MSDRVPPRIELAARGFNEYWNRTDGEQVAGSLSSGLDLLCEQLYVRVHEDVERVYGMDSMLVPISALKTEQVTKLETEIFQVAICNIATSEFGYLPREDKHLLSWFARFRLEADADKPNVRERIDYYLGKNQHERGLAFLDVLSRTTREARQAPAVMFRLYPRAIQIVVASAFNDSQRARLIRDEQVAILPDIEGCDKCRGRLLANGSQCIKCGNPVWTYAQMNLAE